MAYFEDLSEYAYHRDGSRPGTKNVGWLGLGHDFIKENPTAEVFDLVWQYCRISVAQMRGVHNCEFCPPEMSWSYLPERNGEKLLLGTSEIRVLSEDGTIYAAPTLIYHYICDHHYKAPDVFVRALKQGPRPGSDQYFRRLEELGLEWNRTSAPEKRVRVRLGEQ